MSDTLTCDCCKWESWDVFFEKRHELGRDFFFCFLCVHDETEMSTRERLKKLRDNAPKSAPAQDVNAELLAACKALVTYWETDDDSPPTGSVQSLITIVWQAKAAIAKAEEENR